MGQVVNIFYDDSFLDKEQLKWIMFKMTTCELLTASAAQILDLPTMQHLYLNKKYLSEPSASKSNTSVYSRRPVERWA